MIITCISSIFQKTVLKNSLYKPKIKLNTRSSEKKVNTDVRTSIVFHYLLSSSLSLYLKVHCKHGNLGFKWSFVPLLVEKRLNGAVTLKNNFCHLWIHNLYSR